MDSPFYEGRKLLKLCTADCSLHISCFEVISKMRINIFVIVANRKLAVLTVKTMTRIVLTRCLDAISLQSRKERNSVQKRIVRIGIPLLHCHMMMADKNWKFRYHRSFRSVYPHRRSYRQNQVHRSCPQSATAYGGHRIPLLSSGQMDYRGYVQA